MSSNAPNRQVRKTHAALLDAFQELVLEQRYADIRIGEIIRRADVGRSTFYEHFRDKDDILRQSLAGIMACLADALLDKFDVKRLQVVLDHFRQNDRLARGMVNGPSSPQVVSVLANLIEERLTTLYRTTEAMSRFPVDLAAAHIAEGQLGLVRAWLNWGAACPAVAIATALHQSASASRRALFQVQAAR